MSWNEKIFFGADAYYAGLLADIDSAQSTIDLEVYIFENDTIGQKIAAHLIQAHERGVQVRVLVDGIGSLYWEGTLGAQFRQAGILSKVYHPPIWNPWYWESLSHYFIRLNRRNHRKVCLVDEQIAWVGSVNITDTHLEQKWHDTSVRLENGDFGVLKGAFERAWQSGQKRGRLPITLGPIRLNNTRRRRRMLYRDLLHRVSRASQRVWIMNPYFVPQGALVRVLKKAAKRDVDVCLLLPQKPDVIFIRWVTTLFYQELLDAKIRIVEHTQGVMHSKVLLVDDWCTVGSSNLNSRSLMHDLEADVVLQKSASKKLIEERFIQDTNTGYPVNQNDVGKHAILQKFAGKVLLLFKYWL